MTDQKDFADEDENIFSEEDISQNSPSKGNRIIPTWLMGDFMSWLARDHPEISMLWNLSRPRMSQLIKEFEYTAGKRYKYTVQDWEHDFKLR